ncbi:TrbI/VirB10 family protein [Rugamonas sp. A1-17]|nr:TrbI/VirB10 family protein [Rugamonas sp. A1-17]
MAKDPFKYVPTIPSEEAEPASFNAAPSASAEKAVIGKGGTPKNLMKGAQKWGVVLAALGVIIWGLMPEPQKGKVKEATPVEVDTSKQTTDTTNLMNTLKEQAKQSPPPPAAVPPANVAGTQVDANGRPIGGFPGGVAPIIQGGPGQGAAQPLPTQYAGGQAMPYKSNLPMPQGDPEAIAAKLKRDEEIRAAPLEVQGTIKLRGAATSQEGLSSPRLTDLQEQLAAVEAKKEKASQAQSLLGSQAIAGLTQQPPVTKKRGANEEFLATQGDEQRKVLQLQPPVSQIMVQENTGVRAVLLSDVSSDLPGKISAMVTSDVYDSIFHRYVVIPKGSTLIGVYSSEVVIGQECLLIAMTRLILPNGNWISLGGAPATNLIGRSGLNADVNNHFMKMFSTSFVLGATSLLLPKQQSTVSTTNSGAGSVTTGSAAGLALSDALNNMMQRNKNIAPTLSAMRGVEFMFMVSQDMAMVPYKQ